MNRLDPDDVFRALDGPRRAGWAKYYAESEANDGLRRHVDDLERTVIMSLGYWMATGEAHFLYWDVMTRMGLDDRAREYWNRQARWDGVNRATGEVSPLPPVARDLIAAYDLIEHQAKMLVEEMIDRETGP